MDRLNDLGRTRNSWRNWALFFLDAVAEQAKRNANTPDAILALYERLKQQFMDATHSRYAVPLLDAVFELQYFQASQLRWKGDNPSKPTLMSMLRSLERNNIIVEYRTGSGRSASIWWLPEVVRLIEKRP